jgi:hypothetical protein
MSRCRFGAKLCHGGNIFRFMKSEELMAGEDSEPEKTWSELAGTHFYNRKNKIPLKIPESKRSEIRIIAEFHGIPNGFPNLELFRQLGQLTSR